MKLIICLASLLLSIICFGQNQTKAPIINADSLLDVQIKAAEQLCKHIEKEISK
jgi:hypothetical protein